MTERVRLRKEKLRGIVITIITQLHESGHGQSLHRDYSAHFWRWSFARNFITKNDNVIEIGCGQDKPLSKVLTRGVTNCVNRYVGVDLNPLKPSGNQRVTFIGEFNFVERYKELLKGEHKEGFDIAVHFEVIEHMKVEHGTNLLKACFASLKPGGVMLMSTPCYDGVRHAANHIHEYTIPELQKAVEKVGFVVEKRFGTFMDIKHLKSVDSIKKARGDLIGFEGSIELADCIRVVKERLGRYFDNDAISCIFAPLFPDAARNNLWVCRKPIKGAKK